MGDDVGACQHYVISWLNEAGDGPSEHDPAIHDSWPFDEKGKIATKYGPFTRTNRVDVYVFKYCGVHLLYIDDATS